MTTQGWRTRPVAGIGIVGLDHVAVTDSWERDGKSVASRYFEQVGGPVPVALMAMARLGLAEPPRFCGQVGKDAAERAICQYLRDAAVGTSDLRRVTGGKTGHSLVVVNTADGTRSVSNFPGSGLPRAETTPFAGCQDIGLLHTDGRKAGIAVTSALLIRHRGGVASLDLGSWRSDFRREILKEFDIVIASKVGGAGAFPDCATDPVEQTKRFLDGGAAVAGVTLGADGVVIGCRDGNNGVPVHLPAFPVANVLDTCGAGDCFHGAFLWAYREGKSVVEAAMFAQAAVALRIQHYGNAAGLPTRAAVEEFLAGIVTG